MHTHLLDELDDIGVEPDGQQVEEKDARAQTIVVEEQRRIAQEHRRHDATPDRRDERVDESRQQAAFVPDYRGKTPIGCVAERW